MEWLLRLDAAPDDAEVRAAFDAWLDRSEANREAFRVVGRTWDRLGSLPRKHPTANAQLGNRPKIDGMSIERKPSLVTRRRVRPAIAAVAVAVTACLALAFFPSLQMRVLADHVTGVAELREVVLDDGSVVHLDAGSAISLKYRAAHREVALLAGQAFFEVVSVQGRPFTVQAGDVTVTVTGTAFGVRRSLEAVSVAVQSGTVDVSLDDGKPAATLSRGQRLVVDRASRTMVRSEVVPEEVATWRRHRLVVHDVTLDDVVDELQRHFAGLIVLRDRALARRLVTGVFDLTRPVEALNAVAETQNAKLTEITPYLLIISAR